MNVSRTNKLFLTGAIGFGSVLALAAPALAETPAHTGGGMTISLPAPQPEPGDIIIAEPEVKPEAPKDKGTPQPQPDPKPADDLDLAQADPQPEPQPNPHVPDGGEITDTPDCTHGCQPGPEINPDLPPGPGDFDNRPEEGCQLTHGCPGEGDDTPADEDTPAEEDTPVEDEAPAVDAEVLSGSTDRGALPRTGAGLAALAGLGTVLTGVGAAARKLARR